jgi:hypothetical protein
MRKAILLCAAALTLTGESLGPHVASPLVPGSRGGIPPSSFIATWATPTAADCADRAADLLAVKPAGQAIAHTRNDVAPVCPLSDSSCCWVGVNDPRIDSTGLIVQGASSNLLGNSVVATSTWTKDTDSADSGAALVTTIADASASCPMSPFGDVRAALVTPYAASKGVRQDDAGTGTGRGIWLSLATGDGACNVTLADYVGAHPATYTLGALPLWYAGATAADHGISIVSAASSGCARFCAVRAATMAQTWAPKSWQHRATTGSPYSGPATVVSTPAAAGLVAAGRPACIDVTSTQALWAWGDTRIFGNIGRDGQPGSAYLYLYGGVGFQQRNAAATQQTSASAPSAGSHRTVGCWNGTNTKLWIDRVSVGTESGGPLSPQVARDNGTAYLGSLNPPGMTVSAWKLCKRTQAGGCQ